MAQHKLKQKTSLPKGVRQRSQKRIDQSALKSKGPRKGAMFKAPKKTSAVQEAKISAGVSKIINDKNEELMRNRSNQDGKKEPKGKKASKEKKA